MKSITYFYLDGCPYCRRADKMLEKLIASTAEYAHLEIHRIDENKNAEYADLFDYFYVPCFYVDGVKMHEGIATEEKIKAILDAAVK